jgi:virulence factor Mce-like protein
MTVVRRAVPAVVLLALVAAGAWLLFLRGGDPVPQYKIELDNAFGMTKGTELRAAGVNVGSVKTLEVDPKTARAIVTVQVQRKDFGDLRRDAKCSVEPQSLIGEYFIDCQPGRASRLPENGTIPVEQTTGTIPPDVVASVMQRPQREQLSIILSELGAGFAARGPDLQAVIKRAVPALKETDQVLELLAANSDTLRALTRQSDVVMGRLADNRRDVGRFVREARDTATVSAGRRRELAETIRRLPAFLRELRPTLRDLGTVADKQTPALQDLRAAAPRLTQLLQRLGPFAEAADPAVDALGEASKKGTRAVGPARRTVGEVRTLARTAKDPSTNLRFVLEHIDDRNNAVEPSPVSPGGRGFTGLEALLRYPFVQSQAINLFDSRGYTLKINALVNECSGYTNAESAKKDPARTRRCNAWLGPNQPGVTTPDPSSPAARRAVARAGRDEGGRTRSRREAPREERGQEAPREQQPSAPQQQDQGRPSTPAPQAPQLPKVPEVDLGKLLDDLRERLPSTPAPQAPSAPAPQAPSTPAPNREDAAQGLLDFLLGS